MGDGTRFYFVPTLFFLIQPLLLWFLYVRIKFHYNYTVGAIAHQLTGSCMTFYSCWHTARKYPVSASEPQRIRNKRWLLCLSLSLILTRACGVSYEKSNWQISLTLLLFCYIHAGRCTEAKQALFRVNCLVDCWSFGSHVAGATNRRWQHSTFLLLRKILFLLGRCCYSMRKITCY